MIDTSKPWYPQDYPVDEVVKHAEQNLKTDFLSLENKMTHLRDIREDHYIRTHGPAGIFFDLRRHVENALHGQQLHQMVQRDKPNRRLRTDDEGYLRVNPERFMNTLDEVIGLAIIKLEGNSIPDMRFVIQDYAVPVLTQDIKNPLLEDVRPCPNIWQKYWDMVSQERGNTSDE